jgi:hypothetical protein
MPAWMVEQSMRALAQATHAMLQAMQVMKLAMGHKI